MFHRVIIENWLHIAPIIGFALTFAVFTFTFIRAMLMKKDRAATLGGIPLDDGPVKSPDGDSSSDAAKKTDACECTSCHNQGRCQQS